MSCVQLGWSCCGEESGICRVLLRHCAALSAATRAHASATLYALMRQHYQLGNVSTFLFVLLRISAV